MPKGEHLKTHGLLSLGSVTVASRRLNYVWGAMRQRCMNPRNKDYPRYGGRGITVCQEWGDFQTFYDWALASGYQLGLTIERVDVHGNYEPGNCEWIPNAEQALNCEQSVRFTYQGKTQGLRAWADEYGIGYYALKQRVYYGDWEMERALTTPVVRQQDKTQCPSGHPLSGDNLIMDGGYRKCRTCKNEKQNARARARREARTA